MKRLKISLFLVSISLGLSCSQKTTVIPIDSQVVGRWTLVRIVNGFSQLNQTPEQAGYAETIEYRQDGTYQRLTVTKSGQQEDKGRFYVGANPTETGEKEAILYPDDQTTQPFSFRDGNLFLYQRGSQSATIADGSTYEYKRQ